jgi:hypothetical protein
VVGQLAAVDLNLPLRARADAVSKIAAEASQVRRVWLWLCEWLWWE